MSGNPTLKELCVEIALIWNSKFYQSDPACVKAKNSKVKKYNSLPEWLKQHYLIGSDYTDGKMAQAIIDSLPRKDYENYDREMRKEKTFVIPEVDPVTQFDLIRF